MSSSSQKQLRFAALVRVSTEAQKKRGESLAVQRRQIEDAVSRLDGVVVAWYGGQEHATAGWERTQVDKMLADAQHREFDAVMVADLSRWSRDNRRSKEDLESLHRARVRFFVLGSEIDLQKPQDRFFAGITTEVNEFQAAIQAQKSILSRIERARQGKPSCGKLPWGRSWSEPKNQWEIDIQARDNLQTIAKEYLQTNIGFLALAEQWSINVQVLHKLLVGQRPKGQVEPDPPIAGSIWMQRFRLKSAGIEEAIPTSVPPLLDEATLKAIRVKSEARRTWARGPQKKTENIYLFSRKIFDATTGYALTGMANAKGRKYYRPFKDRKGRSWSVRADRLESAVLATLGDALNHQTSFVQAVFDGHGTSDKLVADLLEQQAIHQKEAAKAQKAIERVVDAIADGTISQEDAKNRLEKSKAIRQGHENAVAAIDQRLADLPRTDELETERQLMRAWFKNVKKIKRRLMYGLAFDQDMVNQIFGGKDSAGRKYGVYVTPHLDGNHRRYEFEAYGRLGTVRSSLEPRDEEFYLGEYTPAEDAATLTKIAKGVTKDLGTIGETTFAKR